jgi:hypothetical protein
MMKAKVLGQAIRLLQAYCPIVLLVSCALLTLCPLEVVADRDRCFDRCDKNFPANSREQLRCYKKCEDVYTNEPEEKARKAELEAEALRQTQQRRNAPTGTPGSTSSGSSGSRKPDCYEIGYQYGYCITKGLPISGIPDECRSWPSTKDGIEYGVKSALRGRVFVPGPQYR